MHTVIIRHQVEFRHLAQRENSSKRVAQKRDRLTKIQGFIYCSGYHSKGLIKINESNMYQFTQGYAL